MADDSTDELKQLKRDYLALDRTCYEERGLLIRVIQALGSIASTDPETARTLASMKARLLPEEPLDQAGIEEDLDRFKSRLLSLKDESAAGEPSRDLDAFRDRLLETCRALRKIMITLLEDFYPLGPDLRAQAQDIHLECPENPEGMDIQGTSRDFLRFLDRLKGHINQDVREISNTLFTLLDHVKELEGSFRDEYGPEGGRMKEIEYFEMKVNREVGSIVETFDIHTTISEIKQAVIRKIENIKEIVSLRRKEETSRAESFQKSIRRLKKRMDEVKQSAREMSRRAEEFEAAAMKDELTGLYNRKAFDERMLMCFAAFVEGGRSFSLILFDVDRFKEINDTFGHVAGDKVLQKVGQCLKETFRRNDFIARYGGDEFVVVIEDLSRDLARDKIMTFMKNLQRLRFTSHARGDITVSVSPGIAMVKPGDTVEALVERADRAMYEVKKRRR